MNNLQTLNNYIINLKPGEIGAVIGTSGSGKTTIFKKATQHYNGLYAYFNSDQMYSYDELISKINNINSNTKLIVCDTLTGFPFSDRSKAQDFLALEKQLEELHQLAVKLNIIMLIGITTNRMPKTCTPDIIVSKSSEWMDLTSLVLQCVKIDDAIKINVLKSCVI